MPFQLFPRDKVVGIFRGFREGGLEFHADLALPYRSEFQRIPMHGQFLLVQLETLDEAVLGRIASFSSEGKLAFGVGEEFNLRAVREERPIPEDLREQYLKYKVNIRVLGVLRHSGGRLNFVPSQRRLPHVGSPVAFASDEVLQEIAGHNLEGAGIGHFALGEFVYGGRKYERPASADWLQISEPEVLTKFPVESLVSRRTFIFARAGFGKSNLNKLLFSRLYATTPYVTKRGGRRVPVGTIIFDPDGEYFWPDDKGRPGLCDVPGFEDKLVVFTSRQAPSAFYGSFVAGGIKLDIRQLKPADVIAIAISPERQGQQNVQKLAQLNQERWRRLVDLVDNARNDPEIDPQTVQDEITDILRLDKKGQQDVEAVAARSNMTTIVNMLHDRSSLLMRKLLDALGAGKICVVDVSQLRGMPGLVLSGLILRYVFDHNQREFTKAQSQTIPTIAVLEEAQSVLNDRASASEPYISWVKEGRKYDLGAVLVTQQPGSITDEILSQGDNWFIFHLLSAYDLSRVQKANAHFSEDILSVLLNEPIPGHCVFWSSVGGTPYPVSLRILSFEEIYQQRDPEYQMGHARTYAADLAEKFENDAQEMKQALAKAGPESRAQEYAADPESGSEEESLDVLAGYEQLCSQILQADHEVLGRLYSEKGVPWAELLTLFQKRAPASLRSAYRSPHEIVRIVLDRVVKRDGGTWDTYQKETPTNPKGARYVRAVRP
jgi:uncharacterized protein